MTETTTIRRRLFPSLTDVVFSTTLLFLFLFGKGATYLLKDSDTGWHIRTGEWILANLVVPRQDLFSFSKPAGEWFAWEWLSDVLFAAMHRYAGLAGLVLLAGVVIALVYALLFRFMVGRRSNVLVALALALAASYAGAIHWLARPHMFSWLFAVVFYWILEQTPVERRKIFWLVPLTMLWTNLHGSFAMGLLLVALYGAGELLRAAFAGGGGASGTRRQALARAARYGVLLAACAGASLVNPYGIRLHLHIGAYLNDSYILNHIGEFFSPNFRFAPAKFFEALLLLGLVSAGWAARRGQYAQLLLVVVFAHVSLQSARHIPLYAIFAAPVIATALTDLVAAHRSQELAGWLRRLLAGLERFAADIGRIERVPRVYATSAVIAAMVVLLVTGSSSAGELADFRARFTPDHFPVAAANHLDKNSFAGNLFTTDQWSSYLIYRAYPRIRVFIDGRSDYYGEKLGNLYLNVMSVHHTWQETLNRYQVDSVLLPVDAGLAGALKESSRWKVAYDDGVAILFHRVSGPPEPLLAAAGDTTRRAEEVRR